MNSFDFYILYTLFWRAPIDSEFYSNKFSKFNRKNQAKFFKILVINNFSKEIVLFLYKFIKWQRYSANSGGIIQKRISENLWKFQKLFESIILDKSFDILRDIFLPGYFSFLVKIFGRIGEHIWSFWNSFLSNKKLKTYNQNP